MFPCEIFLLHNFGVASEISLNGFSFNAHKSQKNPEFKILLYPILMLFVWNLFFYQWCYTSFYKLFNTLTCQKYLGIAKRKNEYAIKLLLNFRGDGMHYVTRKLLWGKKTNNIWRIKVKRCRISKLKNKCILTSKTKN